MTILQVLRKAEKDMAIRPIKIFYCYACEDNALQKQLTNHLAPLRRLRNITGWFGHDIRAGAVGERESKEQLESADIILLLISADFMASDYCYMVEMTRALERHKAGTACVIPIILRPVKWEDTPLGDLSPLPTNRVPVTLWSNPDAAWLDIVQGINKVVKDLPLRQLLPSQKADILYKEQGSLFGQLIGKKYLLGELIGEGGFSQVYKAQHLDIQRQQAVKILLEQYFRKSEFRDRFYREVRAIASLDHPHIIHLDDFGVETSQAYLVMPYMSGGTFQGVLESHQGFLEWDQIIFYLEQICAALDYAHKQGIVHLDLKPLNLLLDSNGKLVLSDFGLAHLMKEGVIAGGSSLRIGTPHYMAPEHIKGSPERRSDLFSLGVILYQILVGRLPFEGLPYETILVKNMTEWPPAPRLLRPELSQAVEDMLAKALAKQPEQRYQTAYEFLAAFKKALAPAFDSNHRSLSQSTKIWELPSNWLLNNPIATNLQIPDADILDIAKTIHNTLRAFRVEAEVRPEDINIGPTMIRFGIRSTGKPLMQEDEQGRSVPVKDSVGKIIYETDTRVSHIMALQNDFALVLKVKTVRIEAPRPGRPYVSVVIPNNNRRPVTLREILESEEFQTAKTKSKLVVALGRDTAGAARVGDLAQMPHMLIAGATKASQSACIHTIISSIIAQATPEDVRMLLIASSMVELSIYDGIPHLLAPVVLDMKKVVDLLRIEIAEMERRYRLFSQLSVRNLGGYRKLRTEHSGRGDEPLDNLPSIVIIVDELADPMMDAPNEVEGLICHLAQHGCAVGIHLVVATRRPSVDVITSPIKASIPTRISFMVSSAVDSQTIIDVGGAERLLDDGDMLYLSTSAGKPERIQGASVTDEEAEQLAQYWRQQAARHALTENQKAMPAAEPVPPSL